MVMNVHFVALFPLKVPVRLVGVLERRVVVSVLVNRRQVLYVPREATLNVVGNVNMFVAVYQLVVLMVYEFDHSLPRMCSLSYSNRPSPAACGSRAHRT